MLATLSSGEPLPFHRWASRPPLGWNSWDCFATTVTEEQVRAQAEYMATHLARYGWQYIVVDIQWYEPGATGFAYRDQAPLTLDAWGRLLPAPNRFPSARGGVGFKALADAIHGLGLKFGVHLMRGIPRQAVMLDLPIFGAEQRASEIADRQRVCAWNPDMFGIDMSRPGAQAYYDSVFALFSEWGVDYVKLDDMSRPYHDNEPEIEAVRRAIDRTGRPMVLSLSPGETALSASEHVKRHANLWRISDDFWDNWHSLREQFARLERWNEHRGPGHWPDADMLPIGVLDCGRRSTRFTREEQITMMSLWAIARSPLMHGGDLTRSDEWTLSLLSNEEVLAVNQHSSGNRPLFTRDGLIAWVADVPGSDAYYVALFNARDRIPLDPRQASFRGEVNSAGPRAALDIDVDVSGGAKLFLVADDGAGNASHPFAVWGEPRLALSDGTERALTERDWVDASAWWGVTPGGQSPSGQPLALCAESTTRGLGGPTKLVFEFDLPANAQRFRAKCGFDVSAIPDAATTLRFLVFVVPRVAISAEPGVSVALRAEDLGLRGPLQVRDLWLHTDLGEFASEFAPMLPWHGAGIYRISAKPR